MCNRGFGDKGKTTRKPSLELFRRADSKFINSAIGIRDDKNGVVCDIDYEGILRNQASTLAISKNKFSVEYRLQLYLIDRLIISMSEEKGKVTEGSIGTEWKF